MAVEETRKRRKKKVLPLSKRQLIAFQRFGLGARPGDFSRVKNPLKSLRKELSTPGITLVAKTSLLPTYKQACALGETGKTDLPGLVANADNSVTVFRRELDARFRKHLSVKFGFAERLVLFWANHFSMSSNKEVRTVVRSTIGQLERDVIRKHALGKFPDMLVGVMTHPAMIVYLDNQISVGPNSESAKSGNLFNDVNVNLAREIHELHTVGSGGGYTEADVKALALILSGWTFVTESDASHNADGGSYANVGQFIYKARWHEPAASFKHMGVVRANKGSATGVEVLRWLALRPQTAEFLAFKMLKHFITDNPTPKMVKPLKAAYLKGGGDLKAMALAMLDLKSAWTVPLRKYRTPYETVVAQYRAMRTMHTPYAVSSGSDVSNYQTTRWNLAFLNQKPWECLDPDGWDDDSAEWLNPDALRVGLAAAYEAVSTYAPASVAVTAKSPIGLGSPAGVAALGKAILGTNLTSTTVAAIKAAPTAKAALAILFVSPEFMRR
jgi:uncharacterized protein (DUF1800 family)